MTIPNPYLDSAQPFIYHNGHDIMDLDITDYVEKLKTSQQERRKFCMQYSFAIPNQRALDCIAKYGPIQEYGAGTGYWASLISSVADIEAYDVGTTSYSFTGKYFNVGPLPSLPDPLRTLLLCWPCYNSPWAFNLLKQYHGNYLLYIGESKGGCCADDDFFDHIETYFDTIKIVNIPQWPGIHDYLAVYKLKEV